MTDFKRKILRFFGAALCALSVGMSARAALPPKFYSNLHYRSDKILFSKLECLSQTTADERIGYLLENILSQIGREIKRFEMQKSAWTYSPLSFERYALGQLIAQNFKIISIDDDAAMQLVSIYIDKPVEELKKIMSDNHACFIYPNFFKTFKEHLKTPRFYLINLWQIDDNGDIRVKNVNLWYDF